jgi:1,4-alpha-glucan branching enzyme
VDGKWITDPANPNVRDDGKGNQNSYIQLGEPSMFTLNGYINARQVIVAGSFNGWNEQQLKMTRTTSGWQLPHVLPAGNYQYKFIVDGQWMLDPINPHTGNLADHENSLMAVKANHTFLLKGYANAREVHLAGNFNDWTGYKMKKVSGGWSIDMYLPPGKCLYKFVVDEDWIIDPGNALWEQNEHGTGNSVLWVGQE